MSQENRIEDLEVKVAFQEHTIAELDGVIQKLRTELEDLRSEVAKTRSELLSRLPPAEDAPPPHW